MVRVGTWDLSQAQGDPQGEGFTLVFPTPATPGMEKWQETT